MKPQWRRRFYFRLALALGYPHPDHLLKELNSRQIGEWSAFGMMEPIGQPIPSDPEQIQKDKNKTQRAKLEGGLRALKDKRG